MSRPTHYARKAKSPCPDSRYAFHLTASRILDSEPTPPLGTAPSEITDDMSAAEARYWRRHKPVLELLQEATIKTIKGRLLAIGVPAEFLRDPMAPAVQAFVVEMVQGWQCMLQIHREDRGIGWISKPLVEHHVSILLAARMKTGGNKAAAVYLNHGITRASPTPGLSPDHIARACKRFGHPGSLARKRDLFPVIMANLTNRFAVLDHIYDEARSRPEYQGLRGAALAEAIHEYRDLYEVYCRAEERLGRRRMLLDESSFAAILAA